MQGQRVFDSRDVFVCVFSDFIYLLLGARQILLVAILFFIYLFIYLPHIINYTITITKRYKNVETTGEDA